MQATFNTIHLQHHLHDANPLRRVPQLVLAGQGGKECVYGKGGRIVRATHPLNQRSPCLSMLWFWS